MATTAQKTANRANAQASSGARTDAGHRASSRNSTRHGLTATQVLLPEVAERVKAALAEFRAFLRPQNPVEDALVVDMATASVQRMRAVELHCAEADRVAAEAPLQFDRDRQAEVADAAGLLETEAEEAMDKLLDSAAGCDVLIGRWGRLRFLVSLGADGRLSAEDCREFVHLQGLKAGSPKLRESYDGQVSIRILEDLYSSATDLAAEFVGDLRPRFRQGQYAGLGLGTDPDDVDLGFTGDVEQGRTWLMALIDDHVKELKELAELLRVSVDAPARQMAASRTLYARGGKGELYARYERHHQQAFHKAYALFQKGRAQPTPTGPVSAPGRSPEGVETPVRNEPIYERGEVKRAGAENGARSSPHIPLAVGVGRSGPSQTTPRTRFVHSPHTSPEPEAEGEIPPPPPLTHFEPMPA